jgi:hypothetical protein
VGGGRSFEQGRMIRSPQLEEQCRDRDYRASPSPHRFSEPPTLWGRAGSSDPAWPDRRKPPIRSHPLKENRYVQVRHPRHRRVFGLRSHTAQSLAQAGHTVYASMRETAGRNALKLLRSPAGLPTFELE